MEKVVEDKPRREPVLKLKQRDFEDIYLSADKLPKDLLAELKDLFKADHYYGELYTKLNEFLFQEKKGRLEETAKISHKVIDSLLLENVPDEFISAYLNILLRNRKQIEEVLDHKGAEELFRFIPSHFILDYLQLYDLNLTEKQKINLIDELTHNKDTATQKLSKLPAIFSKKQKKGNYQDILMKNLIDNNRYDIAAKIMKKLHISIDKYPDIQIKLIENAARSMHKWEREKFSWEMLEEVFGRFPTAVAASIRSIMFGRVNAKMVQGLASICKRIPEVTKYLPPKINQQFSKIKGTLANHLRNDQWAPSNKKEYFSLSDFGYEEKSVVWVNRHNIDECLEEMCKSDIIGIDTESTVARTTLDTNYTLLATVQIATPNKVFIYDAKDLKKVDTKSKIAQQFFSNPNVVIVGHTLDADLNGDVTALFGVVDKVKCKCIDICPIFKKYYPEKRAGLAFISEEVLGKQICKEYTLTDWDRRPLFRNQLHYAALDAVVVLKIWEVIKDKNTVTEDELNGERPKNEKKHDRPRHEHNRHFDKPRHGHEQKGDRHKHEQEQRGDKHENEARGDKPKHDYQPKHENQSKGQYKPKHDYQPKHENQSKGQYKPKHDYQPKHENQSKGQYKPKHEYESKRQYKQKREYESEGQYKPKHVHYHRTYKHDQPNID